MKKMMIMTVLMALTSTNAMAGVRCFLQVSGATASLVAVEGPAKNYLFGAIIGNIRATAILDPQNENNVQQLSIDDADRDTKVTAGDLSAEKNTVDLNYYVGDQIVSVMCSAGK